MSRAKLYPCVCQTNEIFDALQTVLVVRQNISIYDSLYELLYITKDDMICEHELETYNGNFLNGTRKNESIQRQDGI